MHYLFEANEFLSNEYLYSTHFKFSDLFSEKMCNLIRIKTKRYFLTS